MLEAPKVTPYIIYAIPAFFIFIGLELLIAKLRNKSEIYRLNDAITNLSCGIGQMVLSVLLKGMLLVGYLYIYRDLRLTTLGADKWWVWVICFIGVDFFYYWFHRYAHEISVMWGGHIVHHQSEEYNLSVALRQSAFQTFFSWVFYLPLALIGFDPAVFLVVAQFQTLYQFWIHTRLIGKMWWPIELIFNTPSHHRVHHGVNPQYIDKNHGGTLIIFDRMFGTFQLEEEEVVYGVTKPLASWNPVWANFDYFADLGRLIVRCRNPLDMLKAIVKGPGWRPAYLGGPQKPGPVTTKTFHKFDTTVSRPLGRYVLAQYVFVILGTSAFLLFSKTLWTMFDDWRAALLMVGLASMIYVAILGIGALLAGKGWGIVAEVLRMAGWMAVGVYFTYGTDYFLPVTLGGAAYAFASLFWLSKVVLPSVGAKNPPLQQG
jgi:alkylglycerol monooxygenase